MNDNGTIALVAVALACVGQMVLAGLVVVLFFAVYKIETIVASILWMNAARGQLEAFEQKLQEKAVDEKREA